MEAPAPFALPEELEVTEIEMIDEVFTLTAHCTRSAPCRPLCGTPAQRFHSQYVRRITDLPSGGKHVCLRVLVRTCFCDVGTCKRKIFAERLTPFVEPLARVTTRLFQSVQVIGVATGGMGGARLAERLGIRTSWMTVLRRIMALPGEPARSVRELGIDDFAWKRGRTYGTILVDLHSHKVLDLLPQRSAETAAAWMAAHPELELVSRDRGGDYASAASTGAPQAKQCADRFHLRKNLGEALEGLLARHLAARRKSQSEQSSTIPLSDGQAKQPSRPHWKAAELSRAKREERLATYEQVVAYATRAFRRRPLPNGSASVMLRFHAGWPKAHFLNNRDVSARRVLMLIFLFSASAGRQVATILCRSIENWWTVATPTRISPSMIR